MSPIPEAHPAYGFYQVSSIGRTTLTVCEAHGGREVYPNDYEVFDMLGQGVFTLEQNTTGLEKVRHGVS